jgi:hypothetical protein
VETVTSRRISATCEPGLDERIVIIGLRDASPAAAIPYKSIS